MKNIINKLKTKAKELKSETYTLYLAYKHPKTPLGAKIFVIIIVAYALSPIDLIPDFIPVLGYLDDLLLIPLGIKIALKLIPEEIMEECREKAKEEVKLPKNKLAGFIIILIWIFILFLIIRAIINLINNK